METEDAGRPGRRRVRAEVVAVAVPTAVMFALGLWGLDRGGMWGDESVTYLVGRRTVPQIWRLLHTVDAVHGLYYLLMHAVLAVHPGEVVLRLPSVFGAAAATGLVAALGTRLARPRVGLWAGLLYAITPMTGHYAQEGRSYALVAAGAAGATLLLVRAVDSRPAPRRWWMYGGVLAATCLLHELAVLVLCAHAATLAAARVPRAVWAGWARAAGAAALALLPLVWVSQAQSGQVAWLRTPGWANVEGLARCFAVGRTGVVFWVYVTLVVVGIGAGRLASVALPLLVLPPTVLMLASQLQPLYDDRYVLYALAGAPLLAAAGADRVVTSAGRLWRRAPRFPYPRFPRLPHPHPVTLTGVLVIAIAFLVCLPLQLKNRSADHRPENLAAVSAVVARQARPGDAVLFLPSVWRVGALAYPRGFRGARDVALAESGARSGTLSGLEAPPGEVRRRLASVRRVWVVAPAYVLSSRRSPGNPTERLKLALVERHFKPVEDFASGRITLGLYVRRPLPGAGAP
ncbi:glycosyltransferase family 39 protein [Streptomyces cylindrosporus]|uniref:Glycosyltransferase family 39 protein n=1 Tax=Streptomyces cylindrosporus TaxID=2927583 RepID=A0ABS9YGG4_9ACTN|nr:glycosyltransferase family 39 protein [Streptomyces cylindrosporus]MCI3276342.1 glycosyltransferase family 39 protein [Streptomyces cylindrosporus]